MQSNEEERKEMKKILYNNKKKVEERRREKKSREKNSRGKFSIIYNLSVFHLRQWTQKEEEMNFAFDELRKLLWLSSPLCPKGLTEP